MKWTVIDMKILVTGFEPFGGEKINPALEAVLQLQDRYDGIEVIKAILPVVFYKSIRILEDLIEYHTPDVVLCIGQAGGRSYISIERVAINIDDARIPDNDGQLPIDLPLRKDGPAAYFSNLPIKAIVQNIQMQGIPAQISNTAGTYVCNHILFGLMDVIAQKYPQIRGGFIHVPYVPSQVAQMPNTPSMNLVDIIRAIEIAIETIVAMAEDIVLSAGTIC